MLLAVVAEPAVGEGTRYAPPRGFGYHGRFRRRGDCGVRRDGSGLVRSPRTNQAGARCDPVTGCDIQRDRRATRGQKIYDRSPCDRDDGRSQLSSKMKGPRATRFSDRAESLLRRIFIEDWSLKLLALTITLTLWFFVSSRPSQREVLVEPRIEGK